LIRLDEDAKAIASMTKAPLRGLPTDTKAPAYIILTSGSTGLPKGVRGFAPGIDQLPALDGA